MKQSIKIETENYDVCNAQTKVLYGYGAFPLYHYFGGRMEEEFKISISDLFLEHFVTALQDVFTKTVSMLINRKENNWRELVVTFHNAFETVEDTNSYPPYTVLFHIGDDNSLYCEYLEDVEIKEYSHESTRAYMNIEDIMVYIDREFEKEHYNLSSKLRGWTDYMNAYYVFFLCMKELADENRIVALSTDKDVTGETELSVDISTCTVTRSFSGYFHGRLSKEFGIGITEEFREKFDGNIKDIFTRVIKNILEEKKEEKVLIRFSRGINTQKYPDYEILFYVNDTGLCCEYSPNVSMNLTTIDDLVPAIKQVGETEFEMDLIDKAITSVYYMFFDCVKQTATEENSVITLLV